MWQNNQEQIIILNQPFQQIFKHILLSFKIPLTHLLGPVPFNLSAAFFHIFFVKSFVTHFLCLILMRKKTQCPLLSFNGFFTYIRDVIPVNHTFQSPRFSFNSLELHLSVRWRKFGWVCLFRRKTPEPGWYTKTS